MQWGGGQPQTAIPWAPHSFFNFNELCLCPQKRATTEFHSVWRQKCNREMIIHPGTGCGFYFLSFKAFLYPESVLQQLLVKLFFFLFFLKVWECQQDTTVQVRSSLIDDLIISIIYFINFFQIQDLLTPIGETPYWLTSATPYLWLYSAMYGQGIGWDHHAILHLVTI